MEFASNNNHLYNLFRNDWKTFMKTKIKSETYVVSKKESIGYSKAGEQLACYPILFFENGAILIYFPADKSEGLSGSVSLAKRQRLFKRNHGYFTTNKLVRWNTDNDFYRNDYSPDVAKLLKGFKFDK